ncbi:diguanylate cyclase domain-containing protein [Geminocystis sp. GBBB08]|uniref:GGDEF domain-containing response regulator n=1 Tax=Geminocystis sp. GBBB08 TaxID=2604140 RepID=UPI0027E27A69|nr:diguanylate cyclase [Geminocystis sp. GBBB08]MBL1211227.1 diguanylate cyclase [Geminocystis sp. GBBB08]
MTNTTKNTTTKILIVEDESIVAEDLQLVLQDLGYDVPLFVDSGEDAIEKALEIKPNLVLMDIKLIGNIDGITAGEKIVDILDIPIIYLTAHGDKTTVERAKLTKPFGYILKPFTKQELRIGIEIALYKYNIYQKLKQNTRWLTTILNSITDGVIVTDTNGYVTFINPLAEKITGWSLTSAINQPLTSVFNLIDEKTKTSLASFLTKIIESGDFVHLPEYTSLISKNGTEIPICNRISPINNSINLNYINNFMGESTGTVLVFTDDTARRIAQQELKRQAFYDSLTNLANRVWFTERLTDAIERVQRNPEYLFAVLFLDLDNFKTINDTLGHWTGDQLLIGVANRLLELVRPIDTVARFGGDEFAILLENVADLKQVCKIAHRIQKSLSTSFTIQEKIVSTNASIGVVLSSMNCNNIETIIKDADIAMYEAKQKGKGRCEIFDLSKVGNNV